MGKIKIHEKALAHLSRGLYRSPASFLRELVSNAWDANATKVWINTNYPLFYQISIEDNGDGFTEQDFIELMEGGIGNSEKRSEEKKLKYNRPIIGRLGIGMLGIAQIAGTFTITSATNEGKGFTARVHLYDLIKERLDKNDPDLVNLDSTNDRIKEIDIGEYTIEEYNDVGRKSGTTIIADDLNPIFVKTFQDSLHLDEYKTPPLDWEKALDIVSRVHSLQQLGDYWRLLWELSAACPLPYIREDSLPNHLVAEIQQELLSYKFELIVDSIKLYKPIKLKDDPDLYTPFKIDNQYRRIYGNDVSFKGYIVLKNTSQIKPDELRGIQLRIKNIGIGYYDQNFLDYRYNEGPRTRWVTGEIFVENGLENALNIDRDSFNRFHPEFRYIQEFLHKLLRDEVFSAARKEVTERSEERAKTLEIIREQSVGKLLSTEENKEFQIKYNNQKLDKSVEPSIDLIEEENKITAIVPSPDSFAVKKPYQQMAPYILLLFEVAMRQKDYESQKRAFTELLTRMLKEW